MSCNHDTGYATTPAQPDEVGWVLMPFEVDICGDIIPAGDLIAYARRLRTNLSEAERSLKELATTKPAPRTPQPQPAAVVLPTVDEVADIIKAGGFYSDSARDILDLIAARLPVWQPVEPGTVIDPADVRVGDRVRLEYSGLVDKAPSDDGWTVSEIRDRRFYLLDRPEPEERDALADRLAAAEVAARGYRERADRAEETMLLAVKRADALAAKVERVRALHRPDFSGNWCDCCWTGPDSHGNGNSPEWPCPTIRALDEEPQP